VRRLLILCCLIGALQVYPVQYACAAPTQYAFRITFFDKKGSPPLSDASTWLSARSITRRANLGILLDSTDRQVSPLYIDTVLSLTQGVMHNKSRWLNHCIVLLTDSSRILQLAGKSYIKSIDYVGFFQNGLHTRKTAPRNKYASEELVPMVAANARVAGSAAYYGTAYTQTDMVAGDYLHDLGLRGKGKLIALLDQGFEGVDTHTAFDSMRREGRLLETYNFVRDTSFVYSYDVHGTQCFSTIAGLKPKSYVGSAPDAQYALYVTEDMAFTDALYELDNLVAGMERADSLGADVISSSLGYNTFVSPSFTAFSKSDLDGHSTIVSRAANIAVSKGIIYVNSAGNEGTSSWNYLLTPGDADSALTVGSVTSARTPSDFSGPGPNASGRVKPDVCLMGTQTAILGTGNSIGNGNGTSYSAPQAAGYAACLLQAFPKASPYQIRAAIDSSAHLHAAPTSKLGYGIPNFKLAYERLAAQFPPAVTEVTVQPNPFVNTILVHLPDGVNTVAVALRDISGRTISINAARSANDVVVGVPVALPLGMYFLTVIADGKLSTTKLNRL
jgi:subtilisin family serine protease